MNITVWIGAFRLRTLPLALSCILMGTFLAASKGFFRWEISLLAAITTLLLQILSNLANDYGDTQNGADNELRTGPTRAVQSGVITKNQMKVALVVFAALSLIAGLSTLFFAFGEISTSFMALLIIGLVAIAAAIKYTAGAKPYGYAGLGDLSVFIFFGVVGVCGTEYLQTKEFSIYSLLAAYSCGVFATAVLNLNNMRDILSDTMAGKNTIPVRIGYNSAKIYHLFLIFSGFLAAIAYYALGTGFSKIMFFLVVMIWWVKDIKYILQSKNGDELDPLLKKTALGTLAFVLLFGISLLF